MTTENLGTETEFVEFKESVGQLSRGIESLCAMLNKHSTGRLLFGVKDNGDIIGITLGNKTITAISQGIANSIKPPVIPEIQIEDHNGKIVLTVEVRGTNKPYAARGEYYIRSGNENRKIEPDLLRELMFQNSGDLLTSLESANPNLTFHQLETLYLENGLKINPETFAENTGLLTNTGKYNYLAELLADTNNCSIKVVLFKGTDKQDLLLKNEYGNKCLLLAMNQAYMYVSSLNETRIDEKKGMQRRETKLFDEECLSEAWANACLHTKWIKHIPPAIYIFLDRIEIVSFGGLAADYTTDEFFAGISRPVNMQLQKIMGQLGIVQQTGHGVTTITARYGKEVFEIGENHITVKIPFAFKPHRTPAQNPGSLTSSQQAVLNELQNNPELTASQIAQNINLSTARVYQIEKELTQKGIIQRSGSRKSGTWTILPKK